MEIKIDNQRRSRVTRIMNKFKLTEQQAEQVVKLRERDEFFNDCFESFD